jgi:transcriptional regulator with GAF, ATPase, and Fis domain
MHCIVQAMQKTGFNRTRAAGLLGVTRRTLGYRINKYKLDMKLEELRHASEQSRQTSVSTLH